MPLNRAQNTHLNRFQDSIIALPNLFSIPALCQSVNVLYGLTEICLGRYTGDKKF